MTFCADINIFRLYNNHQSAFGFLITLKNASMPRSVWRCRQQVLILRHAIIIFINKSQREVQLLAPFMSEAAMPVVDPFYRVI
jgi:hypothetical protein